MTTIKKRCWLVGSLSTLGVAFALALLSAKLTSAQNPPPGTTPTWPTFRVNMGYECPWWATGHCYACAPGYAYGCPTSGPASGWHLAYCNSVPPPTWSCIDTLYSCGANVDCVTGLPVSGVCITGVWCT